MPSVHITINYNISLTEYKTVRNFHTSTLSAVHVNLWSHMTFNVPVQWWSCDGPSSHGEVPCKVVFNSRDHCLHKLKKYHQVAGDSWGIDNMKSEFQEQSKTGTHI